MNIMIFLVFIEVCNKYKGIDVELVYGQQTGNAGIIGTNQYNDLKENSYSVKFNYGN